MNNYQGLIKRLTKTQERADGYHDCSFGNDVYEAAAAIVELTKENLLLEAELDDTKTALQFAFELNLQYLKEVGQVRQERDAAVADLSISACCQTCKYGCGISEAFDNRNIAGGCKKFKWRGLLKEE